MKIDRNDFERWKADAVTLEVMKILRERQDKIAHQIASGACLDSNSEHGKAVGRYLEIQDLREMKYEDLFDKVTIK